MKVELKITKFSYFATLDIAATYEPDIENSSTNFVRTAGSRLDSITTVFHEDVLVLEQAILDAAEEIRTRKLMEAAEGGPVLG